MPVSKNVSPFDPALLLNDLAFVVNKEGKHLNKFDWLSQINLRDKKFSFKDHEYQKDVFECKARRQCAKKGSQMGFTEIFILDDLYSMIDGLYPAGAMVIMPTLPALERHSKARFATLIEENRQIGKFVKNTDTVFLKKVNKAFLYFSSGNLTTKIDGTIESSWALKSAPVDAILLDECDEIDDEAIDLARKRLGHSKVKREVYLSTPSVPDYGIDALYAGSDQRIWMIKCDHCRTDTCLELEFPNSVLLKADGSGYLACKKCHKEIFSRNGRWVAQNPSKEKDMVGWWISRLNSAFEDPGTILKAFQSGKKLQGVYNSDLGMAYVAAENKLTPADVYARCGQEIMAMKHEGPCAMGVDVGTLLNVIIGYRKNKEQLEIIKVARVSSFNDISKLAKDFNVRFAVVDAEPELRKVSEFQRAEKYPVYLCDYQSGTIGGPVWNDEKKLLKVNRTEICDATHDLVTDKGLLILPRRNEEVDVFAKQVSNTIKYLKEDPESKARTYRYKPVGGPDHYRHALNYFWLACKRVSIYEPDTPEKKLMKLLAGNQQKEKSPLMFGLGKTTKEKSPLTWGLTS